MKKVLIWNTFPLSARSGGPATYLFNLRRFFEKWGADITFLDGYTKTEVVERPAGKRSLPLPAILKHLVRVNQNLLRNYRDIQKPRSNNVQLSKYDIIHFHTTYELFGAQKELEGFKGNICLTTHTPMAPYLEYLGDVLPLSCILPSTKRKYREMDEFAFHRADILLFPAREALQPYQQTWPDFEKLIKNKKVEFIPTGVPRPVITKSPEEIRRQLNIPDKAFVVCYAGRHNAVKGYDLLKEAGEVLLNKNSDIYFLVLGRETPLQRFSHERWIEIGWTPDPHSYINAADLFTLPNKQTYFDLILLEVMALGKQMLVSDAGGNRYFKFLEGSGIDFFPTSDLDMFCAKIEQIKHAAVKINKLKDVYEEKFTAEVFARSMLDFYKNL